MRGCKNSGALAGRPAGAFRLVCPAPRNKHPAGVETDGRARNSRRSVSIYHQTRRQPQELPMHLDEPRARIGYQSGAMSRVKNLAVKGVLIAAGAVMLVSAFVVSL